MSIPLPVDINMTEGIRRIPCEYRLLHIAMNKFIAGSDDGTVPKMVDDWRDAAYFQSGDHHIFHEEGTLLFQWEWMRDEACEEWMATADMNEYRVHVLVGESGC